MRKSVFVAVLILIQTLNVSGQIFTPSGTFNKDSIRIGEEVVYSLSLRYPKQIDVVFPDSLYGFNPFELNAKIAFDTKSDSLFSFDSAVYYLTTFEVDTIQRLELPVFLVTKGDSVILRPGSDSVILIQVVKTIPDSIAMRENTAFSNVRLSFNYPYLVVGITALTLISLIIFFLFGKRIRKRIALYRLNRFHRKFVESFVKAIQNLNPRQDYPKLEKLLLRWKKYMEQLNKMPYTKLTSQEIKKLYPDKDLAKALRQIDGAIYGGIINNEITRSFDYLRRVSEDSFYTKTEEIKNG